MPKCKFCGKKTSIWDITADGLCPECAEQNADKTLDEIISEREAEKEATLENMRSQADRGILPPLPSYGLYKSLELHGENLALNKKKEQLSIPIRNIASFKLSQGGGAGRITIQLQRGSDAFVCIGAFAFGLDTDIAVNFKLDYWEIAKMYEAHIRKPNADNQESVPAVNDLRVLKQLVDEGVLTEEEFTAKKKQLLGI